MKTYSITSPSLEGILSDDFLYFEGTRRPQAFFNIRDGVTTDEKKSQEENIITLEQYWNDMYNLFLRKLTLFAGKTPATSEETLKLQALLQELIKVKGLIENASKTAIMGE